MNNKRKNYEIKYKNWFLIFIIILTTQGARIYIGPIK